MFNTHTQHRLCSYILVKLYKIQNPRGFSKDPCSLYAHSTCPVDHGTKKSGLIYFNSTRWTIHAQNLHVRCRQTRKHFHLKTSPSSSNTWFMFWLSALDEALLNQPMTHRSNAETSIDEVSGGKWFKFHWNLRKESNLSAAVVLPAMSSAVHQQPTATAPDWHHLPSSHWHILLLWSSSACISPSLHVATSMLVLHGFLPLQEKKHGHSHQMNILVLQTHSMVAKQLHQQHSCEGYGQGQGQR